MVNFTNVKVINKKHKKVVSTCIFAVQENYLTFKSSLYPLGLLKSVETFPKRMGKDWIYRIYYDSMYDNYKKNNVYIYDTYVYKTSYEDNSYNHVVKSMTEKNMDYVKFLMDWTKHILDKIKDYPYVELIKYDEPKLQNRGYIGHPYTFGSLVRFYAMFDKDVDVFCCVNASEAISKKISNEFKDWDNNDNRNIMVPDTQFIFSVKSFHIMFQKTLKFMKQNDIYPVTRYLLQNNDKTLFRFNAAHFGIKCHKKYIELNGIKLEFKKLRNLLDEYINYLVSDDPIELENNWKYGIDEMVLSTILFPMADIFGDNNLSESVRIMYSGSILTLSNDCGLDKEFENIYKKLNNGNINKKTIKLISSLEHDTRINKLVGGKLLEKIYNKNVTDINVYISNPCLAWSASQINIDEYIPKLFFFDVDDKKLTQKLYGTQNLRDYIDLTLITNKQNKSTNFKNIVLDYSKEKDIIKLIEVMTHQLSDYFKNSDFYIDVIYKYDHKKPFYLMNKQKYNKIKSVLSKSKSKTKSKTNKSKKHTKKIE